MGSYLDFLSFVRGSWRGVASGEAEKQRNSSRHGNELASPAAGEAEELPGGIMSLVGLLLMG